MKFLFALVFTVICKSGTIYEYDGKMTNLYSPHKEDWYYFELNYEEGTYLYVSDLQDTVWFSISNNEFSYEFNNNSMFNDQFEIQK